MDTRINHIASFGQGAKVHFITIFEDDKLGWHRKFAVSCGVESRHNVHESESTKDSRLTMWTVPSASLALNTSRRKCPKKTFLSASPSTNCLTVKNELISVLGLAFVRSKQTLKDLLPCERSVHIQCPCVVLESTFISLTLEDGEIRRLDELRR